MKISEGIMSTVVTAIPFGKKNAISLNSLSAGTGINERDVRRAIESARANGVVILNDYNGKGYYKSKNMDEIYEAYWREKRRMKHMYQATLPMRKLLKAAGRAV